MTTWLPVANLNETPLDFASTFHLIFNGEVANGVDIDSLSSATPLDAMKTQIGQSLHPNFINQQTLFGIFSGKGLGMD